MDVAEVHIQLMIRFVVHTVQMQRGIYGSCKFHFLIFKTRIWFSIFSDLGLRLFL